VRGIDEAIAGFGQRLPAIVDACSRVGVDARPATFFVFEADDAGVPVHEAEEGERSQHGDRTRRSETLVDEGPDPRNHPDCKGNTAQVGDQSRFRVELFRLLRKAIFPFGVERLAGVLLCGRCGVAHWSAREVVPGRL
jgi:hypothetical protein